MHISNRLVLVVLLLCVFLLLCFLCFHCNVFIDVRLSHLNKDYLLTYLNRLQWMLGWGVDKSHQLGSKSRSGADFWKIYDEHRKT